MTTFREALDTTFTEQNSATRLRLARTTCISHRVKRAGIGRRGRCSLERDAGIKLQFQPSQAPELVDSANAGVLPMDAPAPGNRSASVSALATAEGTATISSYTISTRSSGDRTRMSLGGLDGTCLYYPGPGGRDGRARDVGLNWGSSSARQDTPEPPGKHPGFRRGLRPPASSERVAGEPGGISE